MKRAWLEGAALTLASGPLGYALVRVAQRILAPESDPVAVLGAEHSDLRTRCVVTGFLLAGGCIVAPAACARFPGAAPRLVTAATALAFAGATAQGLFVP